MRTFSLILTLLIFSSEAVVAQSRQQASQDLRRMVTRAGKDPEALFLAASFAGEVGLETQAENIFNLVLQVEPQHAGANLALGFVLFNGEWVTPEKKDDLIAEELKEKYGDSGLVEFDRLWIEEAHVADAKNGLFHHTTQAGDEIVGRWEKLQFLRGMVRHPKTGEMIAAEDAEQAAQGLFPLGGDEWGTEEEADELHSDPENPWIIRSKYFQVASTLPIEKITTEVFLHIDWSAEQVMQFFGGNPPHPSRRPAVWIVEGDEAAYQQFGNDYGDEGSTFGAFLTPEPMEQFVGNVRAGASHWQENWKLYWVRNAAGLAMSYAYTGDETDDVPLWFHRGVGSFASRHANPNDAKLFGKQHLDKGGIKRLGDFLEDFSIAAGQAYGGFGGLEYNIYQAGLTLSFCVAGEDKQTLAAMKKVTDAFADGKGVADLIAKLEKVLAKKEKQMQAYLAKVTETTK